MAQPLCTVALCLWLLTTSGIAQGFNDGAPIDREFFDEHISGGHNILLSKFLWPDRDQAFRDKFSDEKEALFRKYACRSFCFSPTNCSHLSLTGVADGPSDYASSASELRLC